MSEIEDDVKSGDNASVTTNAKTRSSKSSINLNIENNIKISQYENEWTKVLIKYFTAINSKDNSIEKIRSKLYNQKNFSSSNLFNFLDNKSKKYLTLNDFKLYLNTNKISFEEKNLRKLIHNFDKDNDFSLNYKEFLGIISPKKEEIKNIKNEQKDEIGVEGKNFISDEIKNIFGELINEELKFVEICNELSHNILNCEKFTTYEAFKEIVGDEKYINIKNLGEYVRNKGLNITDIEINQLMFRIDTDNDGMISYEEFKDIFLPSNNLDYKGFDKNNKNNNNINFNDTKKNNNKINNINISLKIPNNNNNLNNNYNKENKANNKNEINKVLNLDYNINIENNDKKTIYKNENEDLTNISNSLYDQKIRNNKSVIIEPNIIEKEKNNTIIKNNNINNKMSFIEIIKENKTKNNFNKSSNNDLLNQTKLILGYNQKNHKTFYGQKIYYNKKTSIKNIEKQNISMKINKKKKFIDIVLNFDYSRNSNKDKDKGKYYFKENNKNNLINEYGDKQFKYSQNNNSSYNIREKNMKINNLKFYNKNNEQKNKYKNEFISNEVMDYKSFRLNDINNKKNDSNNKSNYYGFMNNNNYIQNNDYSNNNSNNNSFYIKIKESQKKLNLNNSFNSNYIRHNRNGNTIQKNIEYLFIDSLESSTNKNLEHSPLILNKIKKKYNHKTKFTRNIQDKIRERINNSYKMNNSKVYLNYKDKREENTKDNSFNFKTIINKKKIDKHNRSCFLSSFENKNNLFDIDINNKYNNKNIIFNNKKFGCNCNCIEKRCPKCNCLQSTINVNNNKQNNFENYYNYNNLNINKYKTIDYRHFSLPQKIYKKSNTINTTIKDSSNSNSFYYLNSKRNNNFILNKSSNKKNNTNNINRINKNLYLKIKELNINKKCISFYNLLIDFLKQDKTLDNTRQLLSIRDDSNLSDLFQLFNHSSKESISSMDFIQTLKEFGYLINMDEIKYLYRKFNKNLNENFDFEEFCEIILPKKYSTAKIMSEMKTNNDYFFDLTEETKNIICLLFQNMIEGEKSNEKFREIIGLDEDFSGFDLFNKIKKSYAIGIYKEDIANFMKKNKHKLSNREIELLMDRFDKNKDGMIDYNEFLIEITPMNE